MEPFIPVIKLPAKELNTPEIIYAITLPPLFLLALVGILSVDGAFVYYIRDLFMSVTAS